MAISTDFFNLNIQLLDRCFGKNNVFFGRRTHEYSEIAWIKVNNFGLPQMYNRQSTNILLIIPDGFGYGAGIHEFYLDPKLRIIKNGTYLDIPHYYPTEIAPANRFARDGWRYFCLHYQWRTNEDNVLTFLKAVELFLQNPWMN